MTETERACMEALTAVLTRLADLEARVEVLEKAGRNVTRVRVLTAEELAEVYLRRRDGDGSETRTPEPVFEP